MSSTCGCLSQYSKYCIDKKCKTCCKNIKCRIHRKHYCKDCQSLSDNSNKRVKKCKKCQNKKLSCLVCNVQRCDSKCSFSHCKNCCQNIKCAYHFIQDQDVSTELLNDYKVKLCLIENLPVCIIDKIIDDYLDVMEKCKECHYKFSSLSHCISDGVVHSCENCKELVCENCVFEDYTHKRIQRYCTDCFVNDIDHDINHDITDDDDNDDDAM